MRNKKRFLTFFLVILPFYLFPQIPCNSSFCYTAELDTNNQMIVTFQNNSTSTSGLIIDNYWDFGDGSTSNQLNPTHVYSIVDSFIVQLYIMTEAICGDSYSDTIFLGSSCDSTNILTHQYFDCLIVIYPTYVHSKINIDMSELNNQNLTFHLYNILGILIFESKLLNNHIEFNGSL